MIDGATSFVCCPVSRVLYFSIFSLCARSLAFLMILMRWIAKMENCMTLMNKVEWKEEESLPIIESMFEYLSYLTFKDKSQRTFSLSTQSLYTFWENQKAAECKEMISARAWNLLQKLMREFLKEDVWNPNSKFLDENVERYRDTGVLCSLIDTQKVNVNKKLIGQVWQAYRGRIGADAIYLLYDIYDMAGRKVRKEISEYAHKKISGMDAEQIKEFLRKGILEYDETVELVLIRQCEQFSKLEKEHRNRLISKYKPLHHILRLWQDGIIKDIEVFRPYKELDSWFSFVCFPEEFDYENFDVQGWCTWLEPEQYRQKAFQDNRALLKRKFKEALDEGAGEDVRRIYYKFVE